MNESRRTRARAVRCASCAALLAGLVALGGCGTEAIKVSEAALTDRPDARVTGWTAADEPQLVFSPEDEAVVIKVRFDFNYRGVYEWYTIEWVAPDGSPYRVVSDRTEFGSHRDLTATLEIRGRMASRMPGLWRVRVWLQGREGAPDRLLVARLFRILTPDEAGVQGALTRVDPPAPDRERPLASGPRTLAPRAAPAAPAAAVDAPRPAGAPPDSAAGVSRPAGAAPGPVAGAAPEPVAGAAPQPVAGAAPEPVAGAAPEPVAGAAPGPVAGGAPAADAREAPATGGAVPAGDTGLPPGLLISPGLGVALSPPAAPPPGDATSSASTPGLSRAAPSPADAPPDAAPPEPSAGLPPSAPGTVSAEPADPGPAPDASPSRASPRVPALRAESGISSISIEARPAPAAAGRRPWYERWAGCPPLYYPPGPGCVEQAPEE